MFGGALFVISLCVLALSGQVSPSYFYEPGDDLVAFFVTSRKGIQTVQPNNTIVFDSVQLNRGRGYQRDTGDFITPRCGLYVFEFYATSPGGSDQFDIDFYKNGEYLVSAYGKSGSTKVMGGISASIRLSSGDIVNIRARADSSFYASQDAQNRRGYVSFTGYRFAP